MLPKIIFYIKIVKYCVKELIIWQPNKKSQFSKCRRLSEKKFKHTIFTGTTVQYYTFKSFSLLYLPFSAKCTINIYTKCLFVYTAEAAPKNKQTHRESRILSNANLSNQSSSFSQPSSKQCWESSSSSSFCVSCLQWRVEEEEVPCSSVLETLSFCDCGYDYHLWASL